MDYRIEQKDAFQLVSKKKHVSGKEEMTAQQIGQFWQVCGADGTIPALGAYMQADSLFGNCIVGACFGKDAADENFPYAIGAAYNGEPLAHTGFTVEEIPAHTYAVFPCVGKMPEAFQKLYHHIYSEFFPQSDYVPCGGVDFEAYPSADVTAPDYTCEFWIAVEKKKQ